jgi:outer membrane protein OmpA-like peptidoglycan-associated protein
VLLSSALIGPTLGFELKLFLTGTEFDGMPAFEVKFGDTVLETGMLTTLSPEGEEFVFDVPDDYADDALQVRLTNDKYKEGVGDINLTLLRAVVGGKEVLPSSFTYEQNGDVRAGVNGRLNNNSLLAIADAPAGGWVNRDVAQAETAGTEQAEAVAPAVPETTEVADPAAEAPAPMDVQTEPVCETASIAIVGFQNGDLQLSDDQKTQISGFEFADSCSVSVTGFSSTSGGSNVNQRISEARANAVADYLAEISDITSDIVVVGQGETDQFGVDQASNRRVVIEAKPANP